LRAAARRLVRGARRARWLLVVAALLAVTAVAVALSRPGAPAGDPTVGAVVRVGVVDGQSVPAYVASSADELARLLAAPASGPVYALVSFTGYVAPDRLAPLLTGAAVAAVYARVPLPRVQTQLVRIPALRLPGDVTVGMDDVARRKDAEAADDRRLADAAPAGSALRRTYASGAEVAAAEAGAYRAHCACVYAAVVRATPAALDALRRRDGVRAVDPAPEVRRLDRAVFTAPLPEQTALAGPPEDAGLPS
jgi:hypothetical protein